MVLATLMIIAVLIWYLTFGISTRAPAITIVPNLRAETTIEFLESGPARIHAEYVEDIPSALGFVHAVNHTWESLLMRRTALGRLAEWFGPSALPEDRLSRRLMLASAARALFGRLPEPERKLLTGYARGFNAGLRSSAIRASAPLVLMNVTPEEWEPWHSLAVERLWAWLGTNTQEDDPRPGEAQRNDSTISAMLQWKNSSSGAADRALRSRLHLFGFTENLAIALKENDRASMLFRYVTGDTGLPVFQAVSVSIGTSMYLEGLTVPGTLFMPAGRNSSGAWVTLLEADVSFQLLSRPTVVDVSYERIEDDRRQEEIVELVNTRAFEFVVDPQMIETRPPSFSLPDSSNVLVMSWTGFSHKSDIAQWTRVFNGGLPSFSLLSRDGLIWEAGAPGPTIVGSPETTYAAGTVTLITNSVHGADLVRRISRPGEVLRRGSRAIEWLSDDFSTAQDETIERVIESFADSVYDADGLIDSATEEALAYLHAWGGSYDGSSIAASLAEEIHSYSDRHPIDPPPGDSPPTDPRLDTEPPTNLLSNNSARAALRASIDTLSVLYGSDMRDWRWELVQNRKVFFPGDGFQAADPPRRVRQFLKEFRPVSVVGRGHPSALSWGPSERFSWRAASSVWNGAFSPALAGEFEFTHEAVSYSSFLGRFMSENRSAQSRHLHPVIPNGYTSRLRPALNIPDE